MSLWWIVGGMGLVLIPPAVILGLILDACLEDATPISHKDIAEMKPLPQFKNAKVARA